MKTIKLQQTFFKSSNRAHNFSGSPAFVSSVVERTIPGAIFCVKQSYVIRTDSGLYFVTGPVEEELYAFLQRCMTGDGRFTLFVTDTSWQQRLDAAPLRKIPRYAYSLDTAVYQALPRLHPAYPIQRIDAKTIMMSTEFPQVYYEEYWGSVAQFLAHGSGFCMMDEEQIVGEATAIFQSTTAAEVDIFTHPDYRGKGIAKQLAMAFIDHCLAQNITPHWDCDVRNTASIVLAEKIGFTTRKPYAIYVRK